MTLSAIGADDSPTEHPGSNSSPERLDRRVLSGGAVETARALLGMLVIRDDEAGRRIGRIVETEAYDGPTDRASHARAGSTARTAVMFGPAGHAYVYLVYGMHHCLNVVCGDDGQAAAVLIRAIEPVRGVPQMRLRRGRPSDPDTRLGAGPARACQALDIDRSLSGLDLVTDDHLWLGRDASRPIHSTRILAGPRIGVDYAGPDHASRPWRFGVADSPSLSRPFDA